MDNLTPKKRSRVMASIKGKDTKPELLLRKLLWHNGYRYRLHYGKIPGKPDIVFPGRRKAIFVHGCFWHCHQCKYFHWPGTRSEFWRNKLLGNMARDRRNQEELIGLGWDVLVVWECEVKDKDQETLLRKLGGFLDY